MLVAFPQAKALSTSPNTPDAKAPVPAASYAHDDCGKIRLGNVVVSSEYLARIMNRTATQGGRFRMKMNDHPNTSN